MSRPVSGTGDGFACCRRQMGLKRRKSQSAEDTRSRRYLEKVAAQSSRRRRSDDCLAVSVEVYACVEYTSALIRRTNLDWLNVTQTDRK